MFHHNKMRKTLVVTAASCLLAVASFAQSSVPSQNRVTADPVPTVSVRAGRTAPISFTFHIQQGYHVNSNKPLTPELIPTQVGFSPPPDLVIAKMQYPAAQLMSFPFDPTEKLSVYSGEITVKAVVIAQPSTRPGPYTVHGELKYQACDNNACYPPKKLPVDFTVKVGKGVSRRRSGNAQSPHIHN